MEKFNPEKSISPSRTDSPDKNSPGPRSPDLDKDFFDKSWSDFKSLVRSPFSKKLSVSPHPMAEIERVVSQIAHVDSMPPALTEVFKRNPEHQRSVNEVLSLMTTPGVKREELERNIGDLGVDLSNTIPSVSPEDCKMINTLFYNLMEAKYGLGNTQFHTDSIESMIPRDKYSSDKPTRSLLGIAKTKEMLEKDPDSEFALQVKHAQEIARSKGLGETEWTIGDRMPGVGLLTHAGWQQEKKSTAFRTLGLSSGDRVVVAKVPLDFSVLGEIPQQDVVKLLELTAQAAFNADQKKWTDEQLKGWLEEQQNNPMAVSIVYNFVRNSNAEIERMQHELQLSVAQPPGLL